ncbi:hypothetical protein [Streptomyces sp. 184]|uniref:hypothetical protein n=1 Tax=Streptomyces sp. 184 TaxID=1827526 RepID=UPI003892B5E9
MTEQKKPPAKRAAKKTTAKRTPRPRAPKPPRFAVVGTGRSGTGYVAAFMQASGVRCGHERWFRPDDGRTGGLDGDASWCALPAIESGAWKGPVAMVARHPVATVRSLVGTELFLAERAAEPYPAFARAHMPALDGLEPLEAAVEWWVAWNERCAAVADVKLRVEDLRHEWALGELGGALGVQLDPEACAEVPTDVNSRITADIPERDIWRLLDGRAARFGYAP